MVEKGKELDWYGFLGIVGVMSILIIHFMTCVAVLKAHPKADDKFNFLHHRVIPVVTGALTLLPIVGAVYYNLTPPMCYAPWIVLGWFVVGIFVYWRLKKKKPASLLALETEMDMISRN
jgi:amino acid transporter